MADNGRGIAHQAAVAGPADLDGIVRFAREQGVEFAVVAPDDPLVLGAVDRLQAAGIACFGPTKAAAAIEGSKVFAKDLMQRYGIPTARYAAFSELDAALDYVNKMPAPMVVKADGLALGKGVIIAQTRQEAAEAVRSMMEGRVFGDSGSRVVIEEFLEGPEVSVLAFTDGKCVRPMVSSMDHKRALDGDRGLNTGGMGTVAPNPYYTDEIAQVCMDTIFLPTIDAMNREGRTFRGCLYFGLMLTKDGPKVIEYNCRFGDPETQVVLPLLQGDLYTIMRATAEGRLAEVEVRSAPGAACCVVLASQGYPQRYETGFPITLPETAPGEALYVAGAKLENGQLCTAGGRVLGAVATADTLADAIDRAYDLAGRVSFQNAYCRRDIGRRALNAGRE